MSNRINGIILKGIVDMRIPIRIKVNGDSMYPVLKNGDSIDIEKSNIYQPGDILVFRYKNGEIIVHRLLKFEKNRYLCKGDNSFRLEDIGEERIIGKVCRVIHENIEHDISKVDQEFLKMSYLVNREFRKNGYDHQKTIKSQLYLRYKQIYLKSENMTIKG